MNDILVSKKQKEMYIEAQKYLVGGGSAGGRYNDTYGQPLYLNNRNGSKLDDVDGKGIPRGAIRLGNKYLIKL